jgi:hypothetical protein
MRSAKMDVVYRNIIKSINKKKTKFIKDPQSIISYL